MQVELSSYTGTSIVFVFRVFVATDTDIHLKQHLLLLPLTLVHKLQAGRFIWFIIS